MTPFVSIVIVSWNSRADLARCLPTIAAQNYTNYELIIVDNNSADWNLPADHATSHFIRQNFPQAILIENNENLGFAAASNQGFAAARGEILVGLNPDTIVSAEWLSELIRPLSDPTIGLTTPQIVLMDNPDRVNACGNEVSLTGLTFCIGVDEPAEAYAGSTHTPVTAISGAAFAMSRACYEATGGFDGNYFTYFEDTDLSLRAMLAGYHTLFVPTSIVAHDYKFKMSPHKMYHLERNRLTTLLKCLQVSTLARLLPALLLGEIITLGFALLKGPATLSAKLRAWAAVFQLRRSIESLATSDKLIVSQMTTRIRFDQTLPKLLARPLSALCEPLLRANKRFALSRL